MYLISESSYRCLEASQLLSYFSSRVCIVLNKYSNVALYVLFFALIMGCRPHQQSAASCSSLLYAIPVQKSWPPDQSLKHVFHATVIVKLMYCAPACHAFCSASDCIRLDSFLRRCVKLEYAGQSGIVTDMFSEADDALFRKILYNKTHILH